MGHNTYCHSPAPKQIVRLSNSLSIALQQKQAGTEPYLTLVPNAGSLLKIKK